MPPDRLSAQLDAILGALRDTRHSLPDRLVGLSEECAWMLHLMEREPHSLPPEADLARLQDALAAGLLAAIAEDPGVREDETWTNTGALLDALSARTGRPWREPEPPPRALLAELVAILDESPGWPERLVRLGEHPILGDYCRAGELFRRLSEDDSAEVAAAMRRLRRAFTPRKALPRGGWWTSEAPDWIKDWFSCHRRRGEVI